MGDDTGHEVIHDIDDTADRPMSEDEDGSDQGEETTSQQDIDDSVHAFTGHTGMIDIAKGVSSAKEWCSRLYETSFAAGPVFATAWNTRTVNMVATGGGDDTAFLWQVTS